MYAMAVLRPCPCGLTVGAPQPNFSSSSSLRIVQPLSRRGSASAGGILNLKTTPAGRTSHRLRRGGLQRSAVDGPSELDSDDEKRELEDVPFREDREKIDKYAKKTPLSSWDKRMLRTDEFAFFCKAAQNGVRLASNIMNNAALRIYNEQDGISSSHLAKQILPMYVSIFVEVAEKAQDKKIDDETALSFFCAVRGVVAVGHTLLQDALANANHVEYGSSDYILLVQDADKIRHVFKLKMDKLEAEFMTPLYKSMDFALYRTMYTAMLHTGQVLLRLKDVLGYVSGDEESGASETGSSCSMSDN